MDNSMFGCLYCGEITEKPNEEAIEKFGLDMFRCCDHQMVEIDMNEMYKLINSLNTLRENIEAKILEGL